MEPSGKLRWFLKESGEYVLQQEFIQLTLERAKKIWVDVPVIKEKNERNNI